MELGAYLRKSRMEENMDTEEVLARHWAAIQELAQKRGDHIVETYKEVVSGESIFARPEMVKMLEAISDGHLDGILCMDIDLDNETIRVTKSAYHEGNKPMIKETKTAAGTRTVPMLTPLRDKLPAGYSTAAMTRDIYTHLRDTRRKKTAIFINEKLKAAQFVEPFEQD